VVLPHSPSYRIRSFGSCGRVFAASCASESTNATIESANATSEPANATSEPDALAGEDESGRAWNWREVGRYGVIKWLKALLHGKTRGVDHSDFELVNTAIRQEQRRRNAAKSGEARKPTEEASPFASILLETTPPQVHRQSPFSVTNIIPTVRRRCLDAIARFDSIRFDFHRCRLHESLLAPR
jgi:hypothetical protein